MLQQSKQELLTSDETRIILNLRLCVCTLLSTNVFFADSSTDASNEHSAKDNNSLTGLLLDFGWVAGLVLKQARMATKGAS